MNDNPIFPVLETERLVLRELTHDDTGAMFPHYQDPLVWEHIDMEPAIKIEEVDDTINWGRYIFKNGTGILWGLFDKEDNSFAGEMNYVGRQDATFEGSIRRAEVGYNMVRKYWRQGLATEAMKAIINHIFDSTEIYRIEAIIRPANNRSRGLAEKLGFIEEGILRDYIFLNGVYYDNCIYSLLKKEWQG